MDRDFVLLIVLFFFKLSRVYFIVRRATGPRARGRSFRLMRVPAASRAVGEFEDTHTC